MSSSFLIGLSMSSFKIISVFLVFFLTQGCGFQTIYGENDKKNISEFSRIAINSMPNRSGQVLRNHLLFLLKPKGNLLKPIYTLDINLKKSTTSLAVRKNAFATRANLTVYAIFNLNRIEDRKTLYSGKYNITVSYNILDTEYATLAVKKNAIERGLTEISEGIRTQLGFYFSRIHNY